MNARERGFLLLSSNLGDPERHPLSTAQLRVLGERVASAERIAQDRDLEPRDIQALGYGREMAERIVHLLEDEQVLDHYLRRGQRSGCVPISRVSDGYPAVLRQRLGLDAPGCLWAKGDLSLLERCMVSLVGSREIREENRNFAREVGDQAARQGYVLVSGNARGADRTAQESCLAAGGSVICVVADELACHSPRQNMLYISEDGFDQPFSAQRALSRNRVIHSLGSCTFVAQCGYQHGGSWDGTVKNLRFGWSGVFCFDDGSAATELLCHMGAECINVGELNNIRLLSGMKISLFNQ